VTAYVLRRILAIIPVMAVVVTIVFFLIHLIPGDPVSVMLGPDASPAQIQATRAALGLDRPLHEQLYTFYRRVLTADLGHSYFLDRPVTRALAWRWSSGCRRESWPPPTGARGGTAGSCSSPCSASASPDSG
jgi:peptide/nickel transport system permease protein